MSHVVSSSAPISSAHTVKAYSGFGILGADIPTTGDNGGSPVLNDGVTSTSEYHWRVETAPSDGDLTIYPDLSFIWDGTGVADGSYPWVYRLFEDGVSQGTATVSQAGGTQSLAQSARYDNTNGLSYQHTVSAGTVTLDQSARFDNAAQFFAHTVVQAADQFIFPAYYENANGFYQHLIGDGSVEVATGGAFHPPRIDDPAKRRRRDDETLLVIGAI